jgi:hypothetical protein
MPRYVLRAPVSGIPNGGQTQLFGVGTKIADAASAQPGDVKWDALALSPSPACQALDQAALNIILKFVPTIGNQYYLTIG